MKQMMAHLLAEIRTNREGIRAGQDPLLSNDREIHIQEPLLSNSFANKHVPTETTELQQYGAMFSVRSVPRSYTRDKLGAAVSQSVKSRVEGWCEMAASLGVNHLEQ
jgi:hypothetical protein